MTFVERQTKANRMARQDSDNEDPIPHYELKNKIRDLNEEETPRESGNESGNEFMETE